MAAPQELWPKEFDLDSEYMIEDVHMMANCGYPEAGKVLVFIGRLRYRDYLAELEAVETGQQG